MSVLPSDIIAIIFSFSSVEDEDCQRAVNRLWLRARWKARKTVVLTYLPRLSRGIDSSDFRMIVDNIIEYVQKFSLGEVVRHLASDARGVLQNSARRRRPPSGLVASLERLLACFPSLRSFETDLLGIYALHVLHALTPGLCELTIEDNSCLLVPKAVCASAVGSLRALRSAVFLLNNESNSLLSGLLGALPTLDALDTLQMIMETNSKAEFTRVYSAVSRATSLTRLAFGGLWLRE
jgi:hypothetical protein